MKETPVVVQQVAPADALDFQIAFKLPRGYKLNQLAPVTYKLTAEGTQQLVAADELGVRDEATKSNDGAAATVSIPLAAKSGSATLHLAVTFLYCRDGVGGVCKQGTSKWKAPVELNGDAKATSISLTAEANE